MNAQRNLATTQNQQATTFERLSTGLRVNSAKDDAGGLYLAQAQTKDITGLGMATRNAGDGISMAQTAEGALDQIGQNLQRINELAIQAANGTYSDAAREGLQAEVDELTQEINRIVETTEFNGNKLLNADASSETLQISFANNAESRITTGLEGGMVARDGIDEVTYFGSDETFSSANAAAVQLADDFGLTEDDDDEWEFGADHDTAFANALIAAAGSDETGITDALAVDLVNRFGDSDDVKIDFEVEGVTYTATIDLSGADQDGDAEADEIAISSMVGDFGGKTVAVNLGDVDDLSDTLAGEAFVTTATLEGLTFDSNALNAIIDGGLTGEKSVDISTQAAAQDSIQATRNAIDMVSEIRAEFGANMNRFEAVISGNQIYSENLSAARSRIQDADFAVETANLAKQQVLQQAGISALGQANASSQAILGLL